MSACLVKVTTRNKRFFSVGSLTLELDAPNSKKMQMFTTFHECM